MPLRGPFYSQCYVAAALAMMLGGAVDPDQARAVRLVGARRARALALFGLLWFGTLARPPGSTSMREMRAGSAPSATPSRAMVESLAAMCRPARACSG